MRQHWEWSGANPPPEGSQPSPGRRGQMGEGNQHGAVQIRRLKAPNPPRGVEDKWGKETNKSSARRLKNVFRTGGLSNIHNSH